MAISSFAFISSFIFLFFFLHAALLQHVLQIFQLLILQRSYGQGNYRPIAAALTTRSKSTAPGDEWLL